MKLFSAEIMTAEDTRAAKAVTVRKTNQGYTLLRHYITEPENLKALSGDAPVYFSVNHYDTIIDTINVPPVSDSKTFKMLAKNKLKDRMEDGEKYLIAYKQDETSKPDQSGSIEHRVFMIPESLYSDMDVLSEKQKQKTNIFTLSDFAICGLSAKLCPDDVVFHAFADKYKIVVAVSRGKTILYTRMMEYHAVDESTLDSTFYENINLTYMFVTKNLHIDVDTMILSGAISDRTELSAMLFEFNGKPQTVIIPAHIIKGCSREVFHEFLLPISLVMLDQAYDFTPEEYKEIRGMNSAKLFVNLVLVISILVMLNMVIAAYNRMSFSLSRYNMATKTINLKMKDYQHVFENTDDKRYALYYLNKLDANTLDAFDLYEDIGILIDEGGYDNVNFSVSGGIPMVEILGKRDFASLIEADEFKNNIENILDQIDKSGKYKVTDGTKYNMDALTASVRISLTGKKK
ncbi:MAG: hypothetical protein AB7E76_06125 [Deferribacterales bacterium]